jgi:CheY-like chemotaxis protein
MSPRALVIEDNSVVRQFLRLELEHRGWTVAEAEDAYRGLLAFRESGPQLVTLDLVMPINDGLDALQLARMIREEDPEVILLVVSSFAANRDIQSFFQKQQVELFGKPTAGNPKFDKLLERVDDLYQELNTRSK